MSFCQAERKNFIQHRITRTFLAFIQTLYLLNNENTNPKWEKKARQTEHNQVSIKHSDRNAYLWIPPMHILCVCTLWIQFMQHFASKCANVCVFVPLSRRVCECSSRVLTQSSKWIVPENRYLYYTIIWLCGALLPWVTNQVRCNKSLCGRVAYYAYTHKRWFCFGKSVNLQI